MSANDNRLAVILAVTGPVLLDFDGPVTPIFANGRNLRSANELRHLITARHVQIPEPVLGTSDPLEVLRFAGNHGDPALLHDAEQALRAFEVRATADAGMTTGASAFLAACSEVRRPVVIVSNNAEEAVDALLTRHRLRDHVDHIIGRPHSAPDQMKPHPTIVDQALQLLHVEPSRCVLIGDSVTDIEVARTTGVRSIGYIKAPDRLAGLEQAGADATVDSMSKLADAVRAMPALPD